MDNLQEAYLNVYQELDELYKGKHGQSDREYQAGRSDAGKRISGDEDTGPRYYTLGRSRGAKPDAPTAPGARPVNTPKLSQSEREYHQYNKSSAKNRAQYNKVGGEKGLPEEVETDLFDYLLEYLVAEGYADTNQNAIAIMANMSEEWKQSILDEEKKKFPSDKVNTKAAQHEKNYLKRPNSYTGQQSKSRSNKMRAIASTVEVGDDPRNTMHGQDLRKIR